MTHSFICLYYTIIIVADSGSSFLSSIFFSLWCNTSTNLRKKNIIAFSLLWFLGRLSWSPLTSLLEDLIFLKLRYVRSSISHTFLNCFILLFFLFLSRQLLLLLSLNLSSTFSPNLSHSLPSLFFLSLTLTLTLTLFLSLSYCLSFFFLHSPSRPITSFFLGYTNSTSSITHFLWQLKITYIALAVQAVEELQESRIRSSRISIKYVS